MAVFTGLGSAASPSITFSADTNTGIFSPGTDQVAISTNGTGRLFVDAGGNVGLGAGPTNVAGFKRIEIGEAGVSGGLLTLRSSGGAQEANISCSATGLGFTTNSYATPFDARASEIIFGTGSSGTERMRLDSSGRLGIGTTGPARTLSVYSTSSIPCDIESSQNDNALRLLTTGGSGQICGIQNSSGNLLFNASGSERARIDTSGTLLVGTSSAKTASRPFLGTANPVTPVSQIEGFQIYTDEASRCFMLRGNSSGNIFPYFALVRSKGTALGSNTAVASSDTIGALSFQGMDGTNPVEAAVIYAQVDGTPGANDMPGRLVFSTTADGASSPTERMRITQGGNLCINSTGSDNSTGGPLCITGRGTQGMSTWNIGTNGYAALYFNNASGSKVGDIVVNSGGTAYNTTSDYRLKENVVPLAGAIDRVNDLQVRRFNFISNPDKTVDGFIAHEAQAVVPECVTGEKDAVDDDGNPVYQGIDQAKLVPLLTAALQEAIAKIEVLETRLSALEAA